jgi:hypothetical protein
MSYRNKTYIIFNADYPRDDGDIGHYRLMTAWKANEKIDFDFHNAHDLNNLTATASEEQIKRKLRERMKNSKQAIVLVGDHTKSLYKFVRWEIEIAIEMDIPIIAVNLYNANQSTSKTPPILVNNCYFLNVPFEIKKIKYALDNFPGAYHRNKDDAPSSRHYDWSKITL